MSEKVKGFVVTLSADVSEDQARTIALAIGMIRRVAQVDAVPLEGASDHINRTMIRKELQQKLRDVMGMGPKEE